MSVRNIRCNDDPILLKRCKEVRIIDKKVIGILDDMLDTLHHTGNGAAIGCD